MKLSIITINYNNLEGLKQTFESIKNQTYQDFEWIVIDGGSTDGCKEFIEANSKSITYWVSEKDSGLYNAMNKGILVATGEYLNFMNTGDYYYENNTLEKAINKLQGFDIVFGNTMLIYKNKEILEEPPFQLSVNFLFKSGINHQATFFKRKLFFDSFLYNENYKISSDWEFLVYNLIIKNVSYKKLNQIICFYNTFGISNEKKSEAIYFKERDETIKKYFKFIFESTDFQFSNIKYKRISQIDKISQNKLLYKLLKLNLNILMFFIKNKS